MFWQHVLYLARQDRPKSPPSVLYYPGSVGRFDNHRGKPEIRSEPVDNPDDSFQDRIQRVLNAYKREELSSKYDAQFYSGSNSDLPSEAEAEWLDYIDEFERQFAEATPILLREFVGFPSLRPLADIPPSELEAELYHALGILAEHDVLVDFLHGVELAEAYRFVTEELLDEVASDVRIPGLRRRFIYEEFYPNEDEDFFDM